MHSFDAQTKNLLILTAGLEGGTGVVLLAMPSLVASILLGSALDSAAALTIARVGGLALLALAVACWNARQDGPSRAAKGVVGALLLYDAGAAALLAYAGLVLGLAGIALWPAVLLHGVMTVWCALSLFRRASQV